MTEISWFKFENKDLDFPFYRKNPHIPSGGWIVLLIAMLFGMILMGSSRIYIVIPSTVVIIVPVLYFLKWDYKAIFQKPSLRDVGLAVALFVGYMAYSIVMGLILNQYGIFGGTLVEPSTISIWSFFPMIFSLMTEEFLKFIPFMFFMRLIYKYSENRKSAVIISMIITMIFFAALHAYNWEMLKFALCIQGFGSIFEFIGYIKTKNILIPYITHLCTDFFIYMVIILGL